MARQTKEKAAQTREAILDAAEQIFLERGVTRASLEDIARAAGVTRGAVYWHFRGKLDLFLAIKQRLLLPQEELLSRLGQQADPDPVAELEQALEATFDSFSRDPRRQRQLTVLFLRCEYVGEMAPALSRQVEAQKALAAALSRLFRLGHARRPLAAPWLPDEAAMAVHSLVHGMLLRWLRDPAEFRLLPDGLAILRALLATMRADGRG
ncbi:TetR family transcriptional regulator [Roseomonas sp. NAR14]|uniref:TetR family transcriptional regulator n=1 Tax=Roseomonas acroporae TaxID=2937791 RepID=A0A9X1YCR1_9PROT|nr:TetR family transcriptional regulator [Roseomonas acroporae]MCK8786728.1 TetR family transcriptional regulator [Roseomonas acroporae]